MEYSHARSECVVYMQNISRVFWGFFLLRCAKGRLRVKKFVWWLISVWNVYLCICPCMFGGQPIDSLTKNFENKCVFWRGGVGCKDKKATPLLHHLLLHFCHPPFFSPSFTSIHTPIPLFLPPYLRHSAHPALYHHMPQRKYALCSPASELTQHTPPATSRQDPPLSPLSQEKIAKRERENENKERKKE